MKHILFTILVGIPLYCQNPLNALLWKITSPDLDKPSYLFGNLPPYGISQFGTHVVAAINASTYIYAELDIDHPMLRQEIADAILPEEALHLGDGICDKEMEELEVFFRKSYGEGLKVMGEWHPGFLRYIMIPEAMNRNMSSFDSQLINLACQQGKEIFGMENPKEVAGLYYYLPYKYKVNQLIFLAHIGEAFDDQEYLNLEELYKKKDINAIRDLFVNSVNSTYSYAPEIILDQRHEQWLPRMEEAMRMDPIFFALPVEHLGGDKGLVMILRKNGYTVEPYEFY